MEAVGVFGLSTRGFAVKARGSPPRPWPTPSARSPVTLHIKSSVSASLPPSVIPVREKSPRGCTKYVHQFFFLPLKSTVSPVRGHWPRTMSLCLGSLRLPSTAGSPARTTAARRTLHTRPATRLLSPITSGPRGDLLEGSTTDLAGEQETTATTHSEGALGTASAWEKTRFSFQGFPT